MLIVHRAGAETAGTSRRLCGTTFPGSAPGGSTEQPPPCSVSRPLTAYPPHVSTNRPPPAASFRPQPAGVGLCSRVRVEHGVDTLPPRPLADGEQQSEAPWRWCRPCRTREGTAPAKTENQSRHHHGGFRSYDFPDWHVMRDSGTTGAGASTRPEPRVPRRVHRGGGDLR
jgi:hypothetical protein